MRNKSGKFAKTTTEHPIGTVRGSKDSFCKERGVRQGSKEEPLRFNATVQAILEEAFP